jgi:tetratricopeptide (TPR) repeat protein/ribonuclease BN (tRNA processing enzyme)
METQKNFQQLIQEIEDSASLSERITRLVTHLNENSFQYDKDTVIKLITIVCFNDESKSNYDYNLLERDLYSYCDNSKNPQTLFYTGLAMYYHSKSLSIQNKFRKILSQGAIKCFSNIFEEHHNNESISYFLGKSYYTLGTVENEEGHYKKALEFLEKSHYNSENNYRYLNAKGDTYLKLHDFDCAKKEYLLSIELSEERYALPYNGLGNILRNSGYFEEAIKQYEKSYERNPNFLYPLNYIGDCYRHLGQYDLALDTYKVVLNNDKNFLYSNYGIGRVLYELGIRNLNEKLSEKLYEEAKKWLSNALKINSDFPYAKKDLARIYERQYMFKEAENAFKECLDLFKPGFGLEDVKNSLEEIKTYREIERIKQSLPEKNNPANTIICATAFEKIEQEILKRAENFEANFLRADFRLKKEVENCYVEVLKRWNSYTPIIHENSRGGGYYLNIAGTGIVIDPGFDYIHNFRQQNHILADIDYVLVSHSHDDHTADLESIINIVNRYNKRLKNKILPREIAKNRRISSKVVLKSIQNCELQDNKEKLSATDLEIFNQLGREYENKKKTLKLYVSIGVRNKFCGYFNNGESCKGRPVNCTSQESPVCQDNEYIVNVLTPETEIDLPTNAKIRMLDAKHEDKLDPQSKTYGFVIETENSVVIYTGDTGWNEKEIATQYREVYQTYLNKTRLLIAHIGSFKEIERTYIMNPAPNCFYKNHLGRLGLTRLVEELKPNVCLISEFGEEFSGFRVQIANIFNEAFRDFNTFFLPADINLKFDIKKYAVRVISKIDHDQHSREYDYVSPNEAKIHESKKHKCLLYLKRDDLLEDSLIAIDEHYSEDQMVVK